MYTDTAKAFDTVSHSKLLLKVEAYGFKSNLLQWIIKSLFFKMTVLNVYM